MNTVVDVHTSDSAPHNLTQTTDMGSADELSPAEKAYFASGGQDISGLLEDKDYKDVAATYAPTPAAADPAPATAAPDPAVQGADPAPAAQLGEDESFNFEDLQVGQDGRLRDGSGRFVPLSTLRKERERFREARDANNALRTERDSLQSNYDRLSERVNTLTELWQKPAAAEPTAAASAPAPVVEETPPDPENDIFGYVRWQDKQRAKDRADLEAVRAELKAANEAAQAGINSITQGQVQRDALTVYREDAQRLAREDADFAGAYQFLIGQRHRTLAMTGFEDNAARAKQVADEERQLVNMAIERGIRPAKYIMDYALASGFQRGAKPAAQDNPAPTAQPAPAPAPAAPVAFAPLAAPAAPTAQPVMTEADRLAAQARAQQAAATLSGTGGAPATPVNAETIANMSDSEFAAFAAKAGKNAMRQYLGGGV